MVVHEVDRARRGDLGRRSPRRSGARWPRSTRRSVHEVVLVAPAGVPKTSSGKVQRRACRELYLAGGLQPSGQQPAGRGGGARADRRSRSRDALLAAPPPGRMADRRALARPRLRPPGAGRRADARSRAAADRLRPRLAGGGRAQERRRGRARRGAADRRPAGGDVAARGGAADRRSGAGGGTGGAGARRRDRRPASTRSPGGSARSGSSTGWRRRAPPTTSPARRGSRPAPTARRWRGRSRRWSTAIPACAPPSRPRRTGRCSGSPERADVALIQEDAAGWSEAELLAPAAPTRPSGRSTSSGPLFRAALFEREEGDRLVLAVHHVAADFWSLAVMVRELGALYEDGEAAGLPAPSPALHRFRALAGAAAGGALGRRSREHWRQRLAGAPPLDLATDRPRPAAQTFRGAERRLRLGMRADGRPPGAGRRARLDALRGPARRLAGAARPPHRTGRLPGRLAHHRPLGAGAWRPARRSGRLLRQPGGSARRPGG